jgi:hypothetical protein
LRAAPNRWKAFGVADASPHSLDQIVSILPDTVDLATSRFTHASLASDFLNHVEHSKKQHA